MSQGIRIADVRELLGLRTTAATILVAAFVVAFGLIAVISAPSGGVATSLIAWVLIGAAAVLLIRAPGDPLPLLTTVTIAAAGPIASILVFQALPGVIDVSLQLWPLPATAAVGAYLCVRGRTWAGWATMLVASAVCWSWAAMSGYGLGPAVVMSLLNLAPLLMATFFALTIRPAARDIFELQQEAVTAASAESAHSAQLDERDRQLVRLDDEIRPLLERLTDDEPLTDDERAACTLAEARLRDILRAPVLDHPDLAAAAWKARQRGVEVILLDDHGLDGVLPEIRQRILHTVVETLDLANEGTVTVRVLPPGRCTAVTIARSCRETVDLAEFDLDGQPISGVS